MFGSCSRRVRSGEERVAEGAFEFDGFGETGIWVRDEYGLEVGPVPGSLSLDGLGPDSEEALEAFVDCPHRSAVVRWEGVGGGRSGGGHGLEVEGQKWRVERGGDGGFTVLVGVDVVLGHLAI